MGERERLAAKWRTSAALMRKEAGQERADGAWKTADKWEAKAEGIEQCASQLGLAPAPEAVDAALLATARRLRDALVLVGKAYDLAEEENTLGDLYRRTLASPDVQALGKE